MIRLLLVLPFLLLAPRLVRGGEPAPRSPIDLVAPSGEPILFVADATRNRVSVINVIVRSAVRAISLSAPPSGLALDGTTLFITCDDPAGEVYVVETGERRISRSLPAGHMPRSPVLSKDVRTLFVLNRYENMVRFLDVSSGETLARVPVPRQPIDAALTPDGATLVVANHLPVGAADIGSIAAEVSFVDIESQKLVGGVKLPNGSTSLRELSLSPDGNYAVCSHILGRYHNPTSQLVRGWVNTNALSIIDLGTRSLFATVLLDDVDHGAANPWGIAFRQDGQLLAVTHSGSHEVSLIDWPALLDRLSALDDRERSEVQDRLSFLAGVRRRVELPGKGPRAALFVGPDLYVTEYFSGSLAVVKPAGAERKRDRVSTILVGPRVDPDPVRTGELYFHDAGLCFQEWQSCSSCHPGGRADALNWDLLNDGFGNPKNTKSLLLAHETPPSMISGIRASAEIAVRSGIKHIQFAVRPEEDAEALDAFLRSMTPVPSPYLVDGALSPAAERGRDVFDRAHCARCHRGPYLTDLKLYDLGLGRGQDEGRPMDTPTLVEVWRTAPYLHDGRAADLRSMLLDHNDSGWHGKTSDLSETELADLLEYILSL